MLIIIILRIILFKKKNRCKEIMKKEAKKKNMSWIMSKKKLKVKEWIIKVKK